MHSVNIVSNPMKREYQVCMHKTLDLKAHHPLTKEAQIKYTKVLKGNIKRTTSNIQTMVKLSQNSEQSKT